MEIVWFWLHQEVEKPLLYLKRYEEFFSVMHYEITKVS